MSGNKLIRLSGWGLMVGPLAAGGWFLGIIGLGLALGWQEIPYFMILPMLFALLGLSLIGFLLQSDATTPALTKVNKVEQL